MRTGLRSSLFVSLVLACFITGCQGLAFHRTQNESKTHHLIPGIQSELADHKGKTLILGGEVLGLIYRGRQTEVEFAELPLDSWLHPVLGIRPGMSYYVLFPERLDRLRYSKGKIATVRASVIGQKEKEGTSYPLFAYKEVQVWSKLRETRFPDYGIH